MLVSTEYVMAKRKGPCGASLGEEPAQSSQPLVLTRSLLSCCQPASQPCIIQGPLRLCKPRNCHICALSSWPCKAPSTKGYCVIQVPENIQLPDLMWRERLEDASLLPRAEGKPASSFPEREHLACQSDKPAPSSKRWYPLLPQLQNQTRDDGWHFQRHSAVLLEKQEQSSPWL